LPIFTTLSYPLVSYIADWKYKVDKTHCSCR